MIAISFLWLLLEAPQLSAMLNAGYKFMQVCDNNVALSYPGGKAQVLEMGRKYLEYIYNHSNRASIGPFEGGWKSEIYRMTESVRATTCPTMRTFAADNYDLMKKFCWSTADAECSMYSIGSNNMWEFEEEFYKTTKCRSYTFDCIVKSTVPPSIADRANVYDVCIARKTLVDLQGRQWKTYRDLLELTGHQKTGIDYFKMDVEVRRVLYALLAVNCLLM
jgi:hypothetical protein